MAAYPLEIRTLYSWFPFLAARFEGIRPNFGLNTKFSFSEEITCFELCKYYKQKSYWNVIGVILVFIGEQYHKIQQKNSHLTYSIKYPEIFSSVNPAINKLLIYGVCRTNFSHFQTMIGLFASRKFDTMGVTFLWGGIPWSQGQNHILMVFSSVQYYFT